MSNYLFRGGIAGLAVVAAALLFAPDKVMSFIMPPQAPNRPLDDVLQQLAEQPSFSIVQIGAYVGKSGNDPLYDFLCKHLDAATTKRDAKVVLIEPIREYFDQLCENYGQVANIEFENVAIAEEEGEMEMYRLNADPVAAGYPEWLSQLSSLKKERMEELWDGYEKHEEAQKFYLENRVVEKVKCVTLEQLLQKHQLQQFDLLQIDAEGYDFEILKTIDFDKFKPRFINYERVLLQDEEPACRAMLTKHGYRLIDWGQDTLCILGN